MFIDGLQVLEVPPRILQPLNYLVFFFIFCFALCYSIGTLDTPLITSSKLNFLFGFLSSGFDDTLSVVCDLNVATFSACEIMIKAGVFCSSYLPTDPLGHGTAAGCPNLVCGHQMPASNAFGQPL